MYVKSSSGIDERKNEGKASSLLASYCKRLEWWLMDIGHMLTNLLCSTNELLRLLDQVKYRFSKEYQGPFESMWDALQPLLKVLISDQLLKHSNISVRLEGAYCICELTRIIALDIPYDDTQMKKDFELIVCIFKLLSDWTR